MTYERTVFTNGATVNAAQVLNKFDAAIYELYQEMNGHTVWENEDTTVVFAAQDVEVETDQEPLYYEIQYMLQNTNQYLMTTGKIPIAYNTDLVATSGNNRYRRVTVTPDSTNGKVTFAFTTGYQGTAGNTGYCIPAAIKLYYM